VDFGDETAEFIREYIKGLEPEEPLIKISRQQVYNIVRDCARLIKLGGKVILNTKTGRKHFVHPHNFPDRWHSRKY
jgi:hypothetical protein